jgi:hypothetical protein
LQYLHNRELVDSPGICDTGAFARRLSPLCERSETALAALMFPAAEEVISG